MNRIDIDIERPLDPQLEPAARALAAGRLVAFPTETVYGLGADATNPEAVGAIYAAKGRPPTNPLIVHLHEAQAARRIVAAWPEAAERLARAFWPGPLTLVLPRRPGATAAEVSAGLETVALRVPDHPVARALIRLARVPVCAPSANPSTRISPTLPAHVEAGLGHAIDWLVAAGPAPVGLESSVVSLASGRPQLLRPGGVAASAIERALGAPLDAPPERAQAGRPHASPGLSALHYAPRAPVQVGPIGQARSLPRGAAAIITTRRAPIADEVRRRPLPRDPSGYASALYATLHELDALSPTVIWIEAIPEGRAWDAVRDRVARASARREADGSERARPTGRRRQRADGAQTRDALIEAAERAFALRGFEGASLRQIADAAGASAATVKYHFGDKLGLFDEVYARGHADFVRAVIPSVERAAACVERDALRVALANVVTAIHDFAEARPDFLALVVLRLTERGPERAPREGLLDLDSIRALEAPFELLVGRGTIPALDARAFIASTVAGFCLWHQMLRRKPYWVDPGAPASALRARSEAYWTEHLCRALGAYTENR